jgi:carboxymethylenebutenolidase
MEVHTVWTTLDVETDNPPATEPMDAFIARPAEGGPWPGVIVFQEIFGVNEHIREVCARVAQQGYIAIAPDIYHRTVQRFEVGYSAEDVAAGREHKQQCTQTGVLADAAACVRELKARPDCTGAIGCVGFCFGGHVAFVAATNADIQAAVCFYGGGIGANGIGTETPSSTLAPRIKARMLMLYGGMDKAILPQQVEAVRAALEGAGVQHEVMTYPQAGHGFACDRRDAYRPEDSDDAWERTFNLFAETLAG